LSKKAFYSKEPERYLMPYGAIGDADVGLGDSIIMVPDSQGEEYKPMQSGIHLYVEDCDAIHKRAMEAGATSIMEPADQYYGDRSANIH
jgi:PhnB protein